MARKKSYMSKRSYAKSYTGRPSRGYVANRSRRSGKASEVFGVYMPGLEYLVGIGIGMTSLDNNVSMPVKILAASLPLKGQIGGRISRLARGVIAGDALQALTGYSLPIGGIGGTAPSNIKWAGE